MDMQNNNRHNDSTHALNFNQSEKTSLGRKLKLLLLLRVGGGGNKKDPKQVSSDDFD